MKKLLMTTAACGLVMAAAPAHAEVELDLGGYFKGYGVFVDQDNEPNVESNDFDIVRDTELHFSGETVLDNGLVVGFHLESDVDQADNSFGVDESYAYFAGQWGRVNFGAEDGAGYLLQVAAPSADTNIDGIRQYVQPVDYTTMLATAGTATTIETAGLDYEMDPSGKSDKFTYLTPIVNGFQVGVSFSPDSDNADDIDGVGSDDVAGAAGATYEAAFRYEGQFDAIGVIFGAGFAHTELEAETAGLPAGSRSDDRETWNVGLDLDIGAFGLGAIYKEDDAFEVRNATNTGTIDEEEVWVVGADYTTGPFKFGISYYDAENTLGVDGLDTQRYSGGVTYTYGPGMTFRGSVGYVEHDQTGLVTGGNDADATYVTLGTQINF